MQISQVNNTTSFGMAYRVSAKAGKELVEAVGNSRSKALNMMSIKRMYQELPDIIEISKPKDTKAGKILVKLQRDGFNDVEKMASAKAFVKNPIRFVSELNKELCAKQYDAKASEAVKILAEEAAKSVG